MNDRFKFRVWLEYAKLYYGLDSFYYDMLKNKYTFHFEDGHTKTIKEKDCVVEQCTGLKDHNGVLIYEGDLIRYEKQIHTVFWDDDLIGFYTKTNDGIIRSGMDIFKQGIIIGNIHDNKELLNEH